MVAKLHSWRQQIKQHRRAIGVVGIALVVLIVIVLIYLEIRFYGSGFTDKTLWNWLQLLIVPLVLALVALLFQGATTRTERQITQQRYENDQRIVQQRYEKDQELAIDKQREDLLQVYLDRMSELLLEKDLLTSEQSRNVAKYNQATFAG